MKRFMSRMVLAAAVSGGAWAAILGCTYAIAESPIPVSPSSIFPSADGVMQGYTLPNTEYKISFPTMGVVREVKVKEGDIVHKGDVLMIQDDREEKAELAVLEFDASSTKPIDAARAERDLAKVKADWAKKLQAAGGQNDREVAETDAQLKIAEIKLEQAIQEREQYKLKRDKQKTHIERMTITAPEEGMVFSIRNDVGSNVDPTRESIVIVQNSTLKIEVQVPALASTQIKVTDKLKVSYDRKTWVDAEVSMLSPKADAGSGMRMVQLKLTNPSAAPAGLQIFVDLREKLATAAN